MHEEALHQLRQRGRLDGLAGVGEAALDQLGGAVADHGADAVEPDGAAALLGQHGIERAMEVGRAVDQRAVEVEDQDVAGAGPWLRRRLLRLTRLRHSSATPDLVHLDAPGVHYGSAAP